MRYLILVAAAFVAQCALAQSATPNNANQPVVQQPSSAAAAKNVGTHDMTGKADAYLKAQEKKRAAQAKRHGGDDAKLAKASDADVRPGSLMTEDERAEHRKKLHSFKTLDECQKYQQDYEAKVTARAKEQHKTLRPFNEGACNRYKVAADKPAPGKPAAK